MQISNVDNEISAREDSSLVNIYAGKLFDSENERLLDHRVITISPQSGLIVDVQTYDPKHVDVGVDFSNPSNIDLRSLTVLPGFVDCHVHMFLHPYSETSWEDQNTRESLVERTVRATAHARKTLMAGFTAVRDLGTEGAEDADVLFRNCVSGPDPIIPGPRYFCANRALVTTGSYGPKNRLYPNRTGVDGITGAETADGVAECIKVVRRQVGAGADWIKVRVTFNNLKLSRESYQPGNDEYLLDYRFRSQMSQVSPQTAAQSITTFNDEELTAIVETAHKLGVKVAAHTDGFSSWEGLTSPDSAYQVDSVEHGYNVGDASRLSRNGCQERDGQPTFWIPTLSVCYTLGRDTGLWQRAASTFKQAINASSLNVRIACGGDTGPFPHGDNALEMKLMVRLGADWKTVLKWGTLSGWECVRSMRWEGQTGKERLTRVHELREDSRIVGDNEVPFGTVRKGFAADIIATSGDLEVNFEESVDKGSIVFVMKGGKVYKRDGREV